MTAVSSAARLAMSGSAVKAGDARARTRPGATSISSAPAARAASVVASGTSCQANRKRAPGVLHVVLDLPLLEQRVHRHHHSSGPQDAVVDDRELRARWAA